MSDVQGEHTEKLLLGRFGRRCTRSQKPGYTVTGKRTLSVIDEYTLIYIKKNNMATYGSGITRATAGLERLVVVLKYKKHCLVIRH